MIRFFFFFLGILWTFQYSVAQTGLSLQMDSLLSAKSDHSFNGIIWVSENGKASYLQCRGFSDIETKTPLKPSDQFVIGSISKQITAVLVLQEYDRGHLRLHIPIKTYLPELKHAWAGLVTIHHLLTHTHGISENMDSSLIFAPGTQFSYSQIGFELMSKIIEKTSGKSFPELAQNLFRKCKMKNSFHPDVVGYRNLANGYMEEEKGKLTRVAKEESFKNAPVAAGGFISTAHDLSLWNKSLHQGKLLSDSTYRRMISQQPHAIRQHPVFGSTHYGYGITVSDEEGIFQVGQTGLTKSFVSMNFYFPKTRTSVIVLENTVLELYDLKKTFYYHVHTLNIVRENLLSEK